MSDDAFAGLPPIRKLGMHLPVSRELLADVPPSGWLWREPTPEERTRHARARAEAYELLQTRLAAWRHTVRVGGMRSRIATLHAPEERSMGAPTCQGCDFDGCDGEPPEWPCRTVQLLIGEA